MSASNTFGSRSLKLSAPLKGALYMTAAAFFFSIMNYLVRLAGQELNPIEVAFFRNLFALLFMMPWLLRVGRSGLATRRLGGHVWRALFGMGAMFCWFYSVTLMPLAEAVSLNFTVPLFATAGAALVLGEVVRARRWTATAVGFLGVLVILRPGFTDVTWVTGLPIVAAAFMACATLFVKSLSETESPNTIVLYMNLLLTPLSLVPAVFVWQWPSTTTLSYMAMLGLLAAAAHIALTRAYAVADASAVLPLDYTRLPFVAAIAFLAFGEVPDLWTWVGAGIIAGSALYIAHREMRITRSQGAARATRRAALQAPDGR
ncbi:MAG TPA: DMT family transporter [Kiloniellales bacterium]